VNILVTDEAEKFAFDDRAAQRFAELDSI